MVELKAQITARDQSSWIPEGSINVSPIPTFTTDTLIDESNFNAMSSVIATVDTICAHNAHNVNYGDYADYANYSNNSNLSANVNYSQQLHDSSWC